MGFAAIGHAGVYKHVNVNGVRATETDSGWMVGTGAVGPNHVVQTKGGDMKICSKSGACDASVSVKEKLFQNPPFLVGQCYGNLDTNAQVAYDSLADRWVFVAPSTATDYPGICFAVSTSGDPRGTYHRTFFLLNQYYKNLARPGTPRLGVWPDGYYVALDGVVDPFNINGYPVFVFSRTELLAGTTSPEPLYFNVPELFSVPMTLTGSSAPPSGLRNYLFTPSVYYADDPNHGKVPIIQGLNARQVVVDWKTRSNSNANTSVYLPFGANKETGVGCGPEPDHRCISQPNIESWGDPGPFISSGIIWGPFQDAVPYRNLGDYGAALLSHDYDLNQGHWPWLWESIAWNEIRFNGTTPYLHQMGRMTTPPDTASRFASAIAMNQNGDIALGYTHSDHTAYPSVRVTGRQKNDTAGEMTQGEATMVTSTSVIDDLFSRAFSWGHSTMAVDPDGCSFWYFGNYVRSYDWGTRISSFSLPDCNMAENRTVKTSSNESSAYAGSKAVDGSTSSRWSSQFSDSQWICIDLGSTTKFTKVILRWEAAYAKEYKIQTASGSTTCTSGSSWTDRYSTTNGLGGVETLTVNATGRYVRMLGIKRATPYGYSLYEFEVYPQ